MVKPETLIGKYRVIRKIGTGGMADVYLVEDTVMGRQVAMKVLPSEFARDPERISRFEKEVRNLAALDHPNIVTIFDVGHENGSYYYTMTLLSGGDLKRRIKEGLTSEQTLEIMKQMADALRFAHGKGLIHRDIKPTNIMFDSEGRPLLTDMGIAKAVGSDTHLTKTGTSLGTPRYMSPEQVQGQSDIDGRSDLYSLGVVLYEALTGNVPFNADSAVGVAIQHVQSPVPQLPEALGRYQPLINRLLAKDPDDRYADASVLIPVIEQLCSEVRLDHSTVTTQVIGDWYKKSRYIWWIGGILATLVLASAFFIYRIQSDQAKPTNGEGALVTPSRPMSQSDRSDTLISASPSSGSMGNDSSIAQRDLNYVGKDLQPQTAEELADTQSTNQRDVEGEVGRRTEGHVYSQKIQPDTGGQAAEDARPVLITRLRSNPKRLLEKHLKVVIKKYNFYDRKRNGSGDFKNAMVDNKDGTITDKATGLIWEKRGSATNLSRFKADQYIKNLNQNNFSGRSNWRLPTIVELASLFESHRSQENNMYIDPMFSDPNGRRVNWYWSSDGTDPVYGCLHGAWAANFSDGTIFDASWGLSNEAYQSPCISDTELMVKAVYSSQPADHR